MTAAPGGLGAASGVAADVATALAYHDLDITAAMAALRSLALTTVAAVIAEAPAQGDLDALRSGRRLGGAGSLLTGSVLTGSWLAGSRFTSWIASPFRRRIDAAVIDLLWPLVVAPKLGKRRRRRARARLLAPLQHTGRQVETALGETALGETALGETVGEAALVEAAVGDVAVVAAAAAVRPSLRERLAAALQGDGGLLAGAAILDLTLATALRHPALVSALDDILHRRLCREVMTAKSACPRMNPIRLSDRAVFTLIAMARVPRRRFAAPTRRSVFERAWNERAAALWRPGDVPRDFEAWLFTEVLRSRRSRMDHRLAAVARSAGLLGCPRFASPPGKPENPAGVTDTADYSTMPEALARFLRCQI
ncbi:MAG: hypothetical protein J2P53_15530 [Bradyrhizobiaceae bacterium]|nr:hypothetical protein [Bradyrhizobiaceae bacterium]